ncbi:MAG: hypothetical protein M0Q44_02935 [Methylobacter sp.]|jgi:hypothetical protein|nr:hypothetical protein [Methylobacter sp.]
MELPAALGDFLFFNCLIASDRCNCSFLRTVCPRSMPSQARIQRSFRQALDMVLLADSIYLKSIISKTRQAFLILQALTKLMVRTGDGDKDN